MSIADKLKVLVDAESRPISDRCFYVPATHTIIDILMNDVEGMTFDEIKEAIKDKV